MIQYEGQNLRNRLIRQPDQDTLTEDKDGAIEANVTWATSWKTALTMAPKKYVTTHPDYNGLLCASWNVQRVIADVAKMTARFTGLPQTDDQFSFPGPLDGSEGLQVYKAEYPIESHPKFESEIAGTFDNPLNDAWFEQVLDADGNVEGYEFKGFFPFSKYAGRETYEDPTVTYREVTIQKAKPADVASIGYAATPAQAPDPGQGRYWIQSGYDWSRDGGFYRVTNEYQRSKLADWDKTVYEP